MSHCFTILFQVFLWLLLENSFAAENGYLLTHFLVAQRCEIRKVINRDPRMHVSGKFSCGFILLHNNALPYVAKVGKANLQRKKWKILEHSPDLSPYDFHIFGLLEEALKNNRFQSNEKVQNSLK